MRSKFATGGSRFCVRIDHQQSGPACSEPRVEGKLVERCAEHAIPNKQSFESRVSTSPVVAIKEVKLKVTRLGDGVSFGSEVNCLQRAFAKAREAARERLSDGASCANSEADMVARDHVGGRGEHD